MLNGQILDKLVSLSRDSCVQGWGCLTSFEEPQRLTSFVLWVKPFVRADVEWSDTGQMSVFEQRCMRLELVSFSKCSAVFCVARDIN